MQPPGPDSVQTETLCQDHMLFGHSATIQALLELKSLQLSHSGVEVDAAVAEPIGLAG